jgi:hypothetical protein
MLTKQGARPKLEAGPQTSIKNFPARETTLLALLPSAIFAPFTFCLLPLYLSATG